MSDKIRDNNIEKLMQLPCRIIDIFPERVPERMAGRYFVAEQYYLSPPRLEMLRRKYAEIIIKPVDIFFQHRKTALHTSRGVNDQDEVNIVLHLQPLLLFQTH